MDFYLCDDDKAIHVEYKKKILELCKKHNIHCQFFAYESSEDLLFDPNIDQGSTGVLFLDIHMAGMDGLSLAQQLLEEQTPLTVVFLTVSKDHFLPAFDVGAFNYLVKSETTDERFEEVFLKAVESVRYHSQEYLVLNGGGEYRNIPIRDIRYFEVIKKLITVHYNLHDTFQFISQLFAVEDRLYGHGFVRVNRSFLVSVPQIERVTYKRLWLRDGTEISVGRRYYQAIMTGLHDYEIVQAENQAK